MIRINFPSRRNAALSMLVALPLSMAAVSRAANPAPLAEAVQPSPECAPLWTDDAAADFVALLIRASAPSTPVWGSYQAADGVFVLDAGKSAAGNSCLGAWRGGRAIAFAALAETPRWLTPLYGYHFHFAGSGGPLDGLVTSAAQPPSVAAWLNGIGVDTAVLMPVKIEGLPFEISALKKVQIAVHEGFHVDVQAPRWLASTGDWPVWDLQPDRAGLESCYDGTEAVSSALAAEREALVTLVESLLDGDPEAACRAGAQFLNSRATRYRALTAVEVKRHDGSAGSCRESEAIMEIEEGTADFVSWARLFELGIADRAQLFSRYRAEQKDVYYLTGAMQMHAISLLVDGQMGPISQEIARSSSPSTGSLTPLLERELAAFCSKSTPSQASN